MKFGTQDSLKSIKSLGPRKMSKTNSKYSNVCNASLKRSLSVVCSSYEATIRYILQRIFADAVIVESDLYECKASH